LPEKLSSETLRLAGLLLAQLDGFALRLAPNRPGEQLYQSSDGKRVRMRTTNDRVLVVTASSADPRSAQLDIEACDFVLIVMPTEMRAIDAVEAFLVPSAVAADSVRTAHAEWLATSPRTSHDNRTFAILFDETSLESGGMFREKWARYRLSRVLHFEPPEPAVRKG
jgi:hypothetical protein